MRELLPHHPPDRVFERLTAPTHVVSQGLIDQRLIARTPSGVGLRTKPFENVVIQADRDPRFVRRRLDHGAPPPLPEIVFFAHKPRSYCFRSRRLAFRTEITRIRSLRHV